MNVKSKFRKIKKKWKSFDNWPAIPRFWAKIKLIMKPALIVTCLLLTFVPVYFQQESLVRVYNGITIPNGVSSIRLNFSDPTSVHITLPYKVENKGFYDLYEISIKISLELEYTHKDTDEEKSQIIISARGDQGFARVGEVFQDIYFKDFMDFDWSHVNDYLLEVNKNKPVSVLMDVEFSFFLAGVERDWIYFSNINLTSDIESAHASYPYSDTSPKTNPSFQVSRLPILVISPIVFGILLFLLVLCVRKAKKNKLKSVNIRKFKKNQIDPVRRKNFFISLRKIVIYTTIIVIWDAILLIQASSSNIYSSQYVFRFVVVIYSSIILMILLNINSLLPLLKPLKFKKYSTNERFRSLLSSVISFAILLIWTSTTMISYEASNNVVIVRDTFPSFVPIMIVAGTNIGEKFFDLINFKIFEEDFRKLMIEEEKSLRKKPHTALNKAEFNKILLLAIQEINKLEDIATVSKIKSFFRQERISSTTNFGSKVNQAYLNSLVNKNLLDTKKVKRKKEDDKVYIITIKGEDLVLKLRSRNNLLSENLESPIFSDNELKELIECPNPECEYFCNPKWLECPICSTILVNTRYCQICGKRLEIDKEVDLICRYCSNIDFDAKNVINACPKCDTEVFSREKYCVNCYFPFIQPSEKFKNVGLNKLYGLSLKLERIPNFLIILAFQLFFIIFIIIDFSIFYGLSVEYNIYYSLIIGLVLASLFFYFQLKLIQVRKERIARDKLYRVKLSIIRYKSEVVEKTSNKKIKTYQVTFRSVNNKIRKIMKKIRLWSKIISFFKFVSILILISSIVIFFWNYLISIILVIIDLSFAYLFVYNVKVQYVNVIFRLATNFDEELYEDFVIYAIKQLNYL